jgi:hypothetical protein
MSTGENIVENYFSSSYEAYDLDIAAPSWLKSDAHVSEQTDFTVVGFKDVNTVEWHVHESLDETTEVGTVLFRAQAKLARADDEDLEVVAEVDAPFQIGGRVELGDESFETEKPETFDLVDPHSP